MDHTNTFLIMIDGSWRYRMEFRNERRNRVEVLQFIGTLEVRMPSNETIQEKTIIRFRF